MDLTKIYTDSDFVNAAVPAGQILVFTGLENGKPVTRYKDSSGNFGTLSGGGGGGGADVTLGQIDANGNFQPLAFNGTEASNSGNPETVENYYGWNGVLPSPSGGIKVIQGGDAVYYKCASVDTESKAWSGYLAVLTDGVYSFEETVTSGLIYGVGFTPVVGNIYNNNATVYINSLYNGIDPSLVFHIRLDKEKTFADTGQTSEVSGNIEYTEYAGVKCAYFNGNSHIYYQDTSNIPKNDDDRTISAYVCPAEYSSDKYVMSIGTNSTNTRYGFGFYENQSIGVWTKGGTAYYDLPYEHNVWYNVIVTFSDGIENVYVNGSLVGTNTRNDVNTGVGGVCVGAGIIDWVDSFIGYIADARVYNRVLTPSEISQLSNEFTPTA